VNKPWHNKDYLYDRYVLKKMTIDKIADECKKMGYEVTSMTIYNGLKKFNLIKNSRKLGQRSIGKKPTNQQGPKKKGYYG
jgi:hypothetical protein